MKNKSFAIEKEDIKVSTSWVRTRSSNQVSKLMCIRRLWWEPPR